MNGGGHLTRPRAVGVLLRSGVQADGDKENTMRMVIAAMVAMTTSVAMADDIADAHR
jgi:hypothetical protein